MKDRPKVNVLMTVLIAVIVGLTGIIVIMKIAKEEEKTPNQNNIQQQINSMSAYITEVDKRSSDTNAKVDRINDRLWVLGTVNQENLARIRNGREKDVISLDANWLPTKNLEYMRDASTLNEEFERRRRQAVPREY